MLASPIAAASPTSTRRAARCCLCSNAGGWPHVFMDTRRNITVFLATRHFVPGSVRPTHLPRQDLRHGTRQPLPIAANHLSSREPLDDDDDAHSLPHMAGHHGHEPQWHQRWRCVPCTSVRSSWLYLWRRMPTSSSSSCQRHGRVPAA